MSNFDWGYPNTVWFGNGRIKDLPKACKVLGIKNPLFVTHKDLAKAKIVEEAFEVWLAEKLEEWYPYTSQEEFDAAYSSMTAALRPWTYDFHVAQNDGTVHGSGSHDKTGRHCQADDPNGKLDITATAGYWLEGATDRGINHICWDGCMFPNSVIEDPATANAILSAMIDVRDAHGWN